MKNEMNIIDAVKELKKYENSKSPILSLYLGSVNLESFKTPFLLTQMHSLIHKNLFQHERTFFKKDIDSIDEYLREETLPQTRSIVFFSGGKNLWKVLEFEFYIPSQMMISQNPYLKPIEEQLTRYQRYLVLLVDRKRARLFTVHLGEIEEQQDFFDGEVPQRVKAKTINLGRGDKIMRDIEGHLHRHLQLVAESTKEFVKGKEIHFIIIGSHHELIPKIKKHLQYPLNKMVLGEFITELNIPLSQILNHSKTIASKINHNIFS